MKRLFSWTKSLAIALLISLMVFANPPSAAAKIETLPGGNYSRALENSGDYIQDIRESGQRGGGGYWTQRGRRSTVGRADSIDPNNAFERAKYNMKRAADNASDDDLIDRARSRVEDLSDEVREKLNLDQPVPDSTKRFMRDTQSKFEDTVEPLTGKERGFYQENIERNRRAVGE